MPASGISPFRGRATPSPHAFRAITAFTALRRFSAGIVACGWLSFDSPPPSFIFYRLRPSAPPSHISLITEGNIRRRQLLRHYVFAARPLHYGFSPSALFSSFHAIIQDIAGFQICTPLASYAVFAIWRFVGCSFIAAVYSSEVSEMARSIVIAGARQIASVLHIISDAIESPRNRHSLPSLSRFRENNALSPCRSFSIFRCCYC